MIRRLLIANRGEIAVRIIRVCRELGVESVAVYSDADRHAMHTAIADRAEYIGGSPPSNSYLNISALIAAARRAQADAVHPGYGFLAQRAEFARACAEADLIFVGPSEAALRRTGSKIEARRLMKEAGVPVIPGHIPADQSEAALLRSVQEIGFPALIKPSAGGGGIGMKIVRDASDVREALPRARREAEAAFGDGTLYVERLLDHPRHVEIQVIADTHGHIVPVFERECSIQRRHQKVIEESPCSVLSPAVRCDMSDAAVSAVRAAGYVNAGTVEFLLEGTRDHARFYFLELNARLQVEHPVTEAVTGIDLVHAQLLIASGKPLCWNQSMLSQRGHAIECRIYAEDPSNDFLPQAGRLLMYREPSGPGIRVDAGTQEGDEVSVFYDPLLAKLIVSAESRAAAIQRAVSALQQYVVLGVPTNIPFLLAILRHPRFAASDIDTGFLDTEIHALQDSLSRELPLGAIAAGVFHDENGRLSGTGAVRAQPTTRDPFDTLQGWGLR